MFDKIYNYALNHCDDIKDSSFQQKKIGVYISIDYNGNYESVEIVENPSAVYVPAIANTGGSSTNILLEKYNIVLGHHDSDVRDIDYMEKAHKVMENCEFLIPVFVFLQTVRNDQTILKVVLDDINNSGCKIKNELCSFKINGQKIEEREDVMTAMLLALPITENNLVGRSSLTGETKKLCVTPIKFKFKYAGYDTPIAPFSKSKSAESYYQSGIEIARLGEDEVSILKAGFEKLLNDPKHYNPFFRMVHWYDTELNIKQEDDFIFSFMEYIRNDETVSCDDDQYDEQAKDVLLAAQEVDLKHTGNVKDNIYHIAFCYAPCDSRYRLYGYREWNIAELYNNLIRLKNESKIETHYGDFSIKNLRSFLYSFVPTTFDKMKRDDYVKNTFSNNVEKLILSIYDGCQIPEIFLYKSVQLASHYISIDQNKKDGKRFSKNQYLNAISTITLYINRKEEHMSNINAYTCGQIFAVYEKLQKDVTNSNNISNLFDMAKKHPSIILSRLATLSKHHLNSAKIKNSGISHYYAKMISELYAAIETIPNTLNIEEQAQFILGYYHQNNILYAKKEN